MLLSPIAAWIVGATYHSVGSRAATRKTTSAAINTTTTATNNDET